VKNTIFAFWFFLGCGIFSLGAQANPAVPDTGDPRLLLALSTIDYPATPGDMYTLSYYASSSGSPVVMQLTLDARYQLKVQHLGTINVRGKTYLQVKAEVENLVSRNFPLSGASFTLHRIGRFTVPVTGETHALGNRSVDGLTRLSAFLSDLTAKASIRFVQVSSENGTVRLHDTFLAARRGDHSQDPYVRPGDRVHIPAAGRIVHIQGEVFRPGRYELLSGEGLPELVEAYGGGFTLEAAPEKTSIARMVFSTAFTRSILNLAWDGRREVEVLDGDMVNIPHKDGNRQAVFFEGAVFPQAGEDDAAAGVVREPNAVPRIPYYIYPGETAGSVSLQAGAFFTEVSDLAQAYILRGTEQFPVNLEQHLYRNDPAGDMPLQGGDVIVVPHRQFYTLLGEVAEAGDRRITTLTRLSSLLTDLSAKASTRLVRVSSASGAVASYDLFLARRFGDLSQDPYIRPGDTIQVPPAGRKVSIAGEVYRPGEYELLPGETLGDLVEYYGDGFTLNADPERLRLSRIKTAEGVPGETRLLRYGDSAAFEPEDRDVIVVGNKGENRPVLFIEGAVSVGIQGGVERTTAEVEGTAKLEYPFYPGETLGNAARALRSRFTAASDLVNAYLIRRGQHIQADLGAFIYRRDMSGDLELENGDRVIIPFYQYFVLVTGAVMAPGRYPYVPDRMADYYINLAGGRDDLLNNGRGIRVTDMNNRKLSGAAFVEPETMIEVPTNRIIARINQYGPVITTVLSIISTTISILLVSGVLR
jgi:protein involved in polysaccharide export with SLBB domain